VLACHLRISGRAVATLAAGAVRVADIHSVCVRCGRAQLPDGAFAEVSAPEQLALSTLALPVTYARNAIAKQSEIDPASLPTVEQLGELGFVRPIRSEHFYNVRNATDAQVREHMRGLFEIPAGATSVRLTTPGVRRGIIVGEDFVEHPFQQQRRRDDPDHMVFSSLAPLTVLEATEIFFVRSARGSSLKFLGAYRDLSAARGSANPYVYHVAYAFGDGRLSTTFRLSGGAQGFRSERVGRLLYAAYAAPVAAIVLASAS
jgi:hypothetical protein